VIRLIILALAVALGTAGIAAAFSQGGSSDPGSAIQLDDARDDDSQRELDTDDAKEDDDDSKDDSRSKGSKDDAKSDTGTTFTPVPVKAGGDSVSRDSAVAAPKPAQNDSVSRDSVSVKPKPTSTPKPAATSTPKPAPTNDDSYSQDSWSAASGSASGSNSR
jgi:hypothetical protein